MIERPLVSVLIAAYNSENYIGDAISSVLASSYSNFELIICDDRSTDQTNAIAAAYQRQDSRIQLYRNETNLGDYPNRNRVASYAKGKYIKYLDHDDMIYPWGLEAMVQCMEQLPEAGYGIMSFGDLPTSTIYPILVAPADAYRAYFFKGALLVGGPTSAIFRRDAFEALKGFSGKPFVGDQEMWLNMSRYYSLARMPMDLVWWREHERQESRREKTDPSHQERRFNVIKAALQHPDCPLPVKEKEMVLQNHKNIRARHIIKLHVFHFEFGEALKQFKLFNLGIADIFRATRKNKIQ